MLCWSIQNTVIVHFDTLTYWRSLKIKWYLPPNVAARVHIESKKEIKIMTWPTGIHYFIFWQVNYHFQIPSIISSIVCIYDFKYLMRWSGTIYDLIKEIIKKGLSMTLLKYKKLKLRNKTFFWRAKVHNLKSS